MKARATGEQIPRLFSCGTIPADKLIRLVDDEGNQLDGVLKKAYIQIMKKMEDSPSPRIIGAVAAACYWRHYLNVARQSGLPFLQELAVINIDGINLSAFARMKASDRGNLNSLNEEFVPAPAEPEDVGVDLSAPIHLAPIEAGWFRKQWGEPLESMVSALSGTKYGKAASVAAAGESFDRRIFDRELDNLVATHLRECRTAAFGIEPVLAYGVAREIEISNLKILIGGRAVGLDKEVILDEMRYSYV
jgi:V/A-type H+-transporting ATPase subunit C